MKLQPTLGLRLIFALSYLVIVTHGRDLSIADFGAVEGKSASSSVNSAAINYAFGNATAGDTVIVPKGAWAATGGITHEKTPVTFKLLGTLLADPDLAQWPLDSKQNHYLDFITVSNVQNLTINGYLTAHSRTVSCEYCLFPLCLCLPVSLSLFLPTLRLSH